jgi:hypothetical protein
MGWSPIRKVKKAASNVADAAGDVVSGAGDIIQDVVIDPVVQLGSNLEDAVRETIEFVDEEVIQSPEVRFIVSAINPAAGAVLDAYATLDSGENLSPTQVANLAAAGYTVSSGTKLPTDVKQAMDVGVAVAEGKDLDEALINAYGSQWIKESGLGEKMNQGIAGVVGSDAANKINKYIEVDKLAKDYLAGTSIERSLANQFGDDLVAGLGSQDPTVNAAAFGGLETLVAKSEGFSNEEALRKGFGVYRDKGGGLYDLNQLAQYVPDVDIGEAINSPEFFKNITAGLDLDASGIEDWIRQNASSIEDAGRDVVEYVADILPETNLDIESRETFDWLAGMQGRAPDVSFIEDYARRYGDDIEDGIRWGIENFPELRLAFLQRNERIPGEKVTKDGEEIVSLDSEFDQIGKDDTLFSREVLSRTPSLGRSVV